MLRKWSRAVIAVWTSLLLAAPASATVTYAFTSDYGDFVFTSPSFFEGGNIPGLGGTVVSHSGNFDQVTFGSSDILLVSPGCLSQDTCFDAIFLEDGIFQRTGAFFASDGDAKIVISGSSDRGLRSRAFDVGLAGGRPRRPRLRQETQNAGRPRLRGFAELLAHRADGSRAVLYAGPRAKRQSRAQRGDNL